jgi:hypothetical protein
LPLIAVLLCQEVTSLIDHPFRISVRADQISKVFRVVDLEIRHCLICDEVFTRQAARAHADTACFPSQRSFELVGENKDANR